MSHLHASLIGIFSGLVRSRDWRKVLKNALFKVVALLLVFLVSWQLFKSARQSETFVFELVIPISTEVDDVIFQAFVSGSSDICLFGPYEEYWNGTVPENFVFLTIQSEGVAPKILSIRRFQFLTDEHGLDIESQVSNVSLGGSVDGCVVATEVAFLSLEVATKRTSANVRALTIQAYIGE
jgi:hypothetical protein